MPDGLLGPKGADVAKKGGRYSLDIQSYVAAFQMLRGCGVNCSPSSPGSGTANTELNMWKKSRIEAFNPQLLF